MTHTPTSTVPSMFNKTWGVTLKSQGTAAKNVKIRYSHAIPTTAQIFLVANTCFRTVATRVSCTTQRSAATTSEAPRRSRSACEIIESNTIKARPKPTWDQPRSATGLVGDGSMSFCLRYVSLLWLVGDRAQGKKSIEERKVEELSGGYGKSLFFCIPVSNGSSVMQVRDKELPKQGQASRAKRSAYSRLSDSVQFCIWSAELVLRLDLVTGSTRRQQ